MERAANIPMQLSDKQKEVISNTLIENLPVLRAKLNLTQDDLAKQLGVTRQTIINVESKKTKISWTMVLALLLIFLANPLTVGLLAGLGILNKQLMSLLGIDNLIDTITNKFKNVK